MSQDSFVEISAGKTLFQEGDPGTLIYLIESGLIELKRAATGKQPGVLLGPGDVCGADFLIDNKPHGASALVKENARLLRLSRGELLGVIGENPEIAIGLLRRLLDGARSGATPTAALAKPAGASGVSVPPSMAAESAQSENLQTEPSPESPIGSARPAVAQAAAIPASTNEPPIRVGDLPASAIYGQFALRVAATGQLLPLESARNDFLVGRPDPSSGMRPEIDLGPFDINRSLSRRHARIVRQDGVYFVREDNATVNGTYANQERLTTGVEVPLKVGDKLRFGTIEVEFVAV